MFPATQFHEFGKDLMFVVKDNTLFHTENAGRPTPDCLFLCNLAFPLVKSESLSSLEKRYREKNAQQIKSFQDTFALQASQANGNPEAIQAEMVKNPGVRFFVTEIIPTYLNKGSISLFKPSRERGSIFEGVVGGDSAVINRRIYPLKEIAKPSVVRVSGKYFMFGPSAKTIAKAEEEFQRSFEEELKQEALLRVRQLSGDSSTDNTFLWAIKKKITRAGECFEYGDLGYDPTLNRVYHLLRPHHNKTTHRHYKEGQGALSVPVLNTNSLASTPAIIYRKDRTSPFTLESVSLCLGTRAYGVTTKDIISFLSRASENIFYNRACHE